MTGGSLWVETGGAQGQAYKEPVALKEVIYLLATDP
jgi:hypothetical protein